jgi:hypothetical protein
MVAKCYETFMARYGGGIQEEFRHYFGVPVLNCADARSRFRPGNDCGQVINQVTRQGIEGAEVEVYGGRDLRYQATSGPDGSFQVKLARREAGGHLEQPAGSGKATGEEDGTVRF